MTKLKQVRLSRKIKAIEVALEQIKDRKPLPGIPAPRTFKDLGLPEMP